ncbi:MAG: PHP domain-containing protein [Acutalibacteraceae bacterium]
MTDCTIRNSIGGNSDGDFCDLHTHSTFSDGTCTPALLIKMAEAAGLSAIALCDHNTINGLESFIRAAADSKVEAVPGIEITADFYGQEVHIVGLFIRPQFYERVNEFVSQIYLSKEQSNAELAERLNAAGLTVDFEEIKKAAKGGYVNRVHFANALVKSGYVGSVQEAFEKYLDDEKGYYIPAKRLDALEVVGFLDSISALPIIAHPLISLSYEDLLRFLTEAKPKGLAGLETNYSLYSEQQTTLAMEIAEQFGLLKSGGSDFHGDNKPNIKMGVGMGNMSVPTEYYEKMKSVIQLKLK